MPHGVEGETSGPPGRAATFFRQSYSHTASSSSVSTRKPRTSTYRPYQPTESVKPSYTVGFGIATPQVGLPVATSQTTTAS